jgi:hypothetical protein
MTRRPGAPPPEFPRIVENIAVMALNRSPGESQLLKRPLTLSLPKTEREPDRKSANAG